MRFEDWYYRSRVQKYGDKTDEECFEYVIEQILKVPCEIPKIHSIFTNPGNYFPDINISLHYKEGNEFLIGGFDMGNRTNIWFYYPDEYYFLAEGALDLSYEFPSLFYEYSKD